MEVKLPVLLGNYDQQPTDRQTDRPGHRKVSIPCTCTVTVQHDYIYGLNVVQKKYACRKWSKKAFESCSRYGPVMRVGFIDLFFFQEKMNPKKEHCIILVSISDYYSHFVRISDMRVSLLLRGSLAHIIKNVYKVLNLGCLTE